MNEEKLIQKTIVIALAILVVGVGATYATALAQPHQRELLAQWIAPSYPPQVSLAGTFYCPEEAPEEVRAASNTFEVVVDDSREWLFAIKEAHNLATVRTKLAILDDIYPRRLSFTGNGKDLNYLKNPNIAGKSFRVQGYLYKDARRLSLSHVEEISAD